MKIKFQRTIYQIFLKGKIQVLGYQGNSLPTKQGKHGKVEKKNGDRKDHGMGGRKNNQFHLSSQKIESN